MIIDAFLLLVFAACLLGPPVLIVSDYRRWRRQRGGA